MTELNFRAFAGLVFLIGVLAASIFIPAWSIRYWQAWLFLAVFATSVSTITLYLVMKDPQLLARRVRGGPNAEKQSIQKLIQLIAGFSFVGMFVLSGVDHRLGWSTMSFYLVVLGDVFVALGLGIAFRVFRENSFASATIEVGPEQRLVSTGPYSVVRHPMYTGGIIMLIGVPMALASWWGLLAVLLIGLAIIWRLVDEEHFLVKNLAGYQAYQASVIWRLVPHVW